MLLRRLYRHIPRASGIRSLRARTSVALLRMDSWRVLVYCGFGRIRRSVRVQFQLVLLSLVCVGRVCGMRVSLPVEGGMRSDMAYRPAMGFLAHSMVHSVFILARSCRWSFAMVVRARRSKTVVPYVESKPIGGTTPEPRNFTGNPNNYSLNTVHTVANQVQPPLPDRPVEAGLMSRARFPGFSSDGSRRTPASS